LFGDIQIGQVFAYAPGDDDGTWPTEPVRSMIEDLGSSDFEDGLRIGSFNKRGPTARGLTDGGRQEYELAERYAEWAGRVGDRSPRTAAEELLVLAVRTSDTHNISMAHVEPTPAPS
jgi:hypothetical protein